MKDIDVSLRRLGLQAADGEYAANGSELRFNCPMCARRGKTHDTKRHLYVHIVNDDRFGRFNCFRCEAKGRLTSKEDTTDFLKIKAAPVKKPSTTVELPPDYQPLQKGLHAYEYVKSRGITDTDITYYHLGIAKGRIVFPDYTKDGVLDYWVARSYTDKTPKYYNCRISRATKIYNLGHFQRMGFSTGTIVEGPISAIIAGRTALATYGKLVTAQQIKILRSLTVKKWYLAFDADAKAKSLEVAKLLWTPDKECWLVPIRRREDPASLGREEFNRVRKEESVLFEMYNRPSQIRFLLAA